jgi:hypothetical protein
MEHADLDAQEVLGRFNRLMHEVMRGCASRNTFEPWEVELLVDMERCGLEPRHAKYVLRRYQKAAERQLDYGVTPPLKLSEYLKRHPSGRG